MPNFNFFRLRIHCWGGLGSQLLALNYYLKIQERYPNRHLILVLHSGGITKRLSEIDGLDSIIQLEKVDDYNSASNNILNSKNRFISLRYTFRVTIKFLTNFFGFVISDDNKIFKIRFWTIAVRCTYSKIQFERKDIKKIAEYLGIFPKAIQHDFIGVHYRFGDLPTLKPNSLIPFYSIGLIVNRINKSQKDAYPIKVYSDSILNDLKLDNLSFKDYEWKSIETLQTINELLRVKYFIGTYSKVSLWVAIFRWGLAIPGEIYIPESMLNNFQYLTNFSDIDCYDLLINTYEFS